MESLTVPELNALQYMKGDRHLSDVRSKIEKQTLPTEELISQYTKNQYVEQTIEVLPGLDATFRTLPPFAMDEALDFASEKRGTDNYARALGRRRLSHALIDINGEVVGTMPVEGSYFQLAKAESRETLKKDIMTRAEDVYEYLSFHGLAEKISEAFGAWEQVVFNRINGIDDVSDTIKNSTRDPEKEQ